MLMFSVNLIFLQRMEDLYKHLKLVRQEQMKPLSATVLDLGEKSYECIVRYEDASLRLIFMELIFFLSGRCSKAFYNAFAFTESPSEDVSAADTEIFYAHEPPKG